MSQLYNVTCRNKECRYSFKVREGVGMRTFMWISPQEDDIKEGTREASGALADLLVSDDGLMHEATYLCPTCREYQNGRYPHVVELKKVTQFGTIRDYKVRFLDGEPKCSKCGSKLEYILNPKSGKHKCPKCGTDQMSVGSIGHFD